MKTTKTVSMQEFSNEVGSLAEKLGKDYHLVRCSMIKFKDSQQFEFQCYITDFDFHTGATRNEALTKLKAQCFPPAKSKIQEVTV